METSQPPKAGAMPSWAGAGSATRSKQQQGWKWKLVKGLSQDNGERREMEGKGMLQGLKSQACSAHNLGVESSSRPWRLRELWP